MSVPAFRDDPAFLFELRVRLAPDLGEKAKFATVRAFEAPIGKQAHRFTSGHTTIEFELVVAGSVLWPRGSTTIGTPAHVSVDGDEAKALALSLFELRPGDTDADFFADYTPEQLAFVERYSDSFWCARTERFGEDS